MSEYYYMTWNEEDDEKIRDFLVKLTGRSDIRKFDCKRNFLNPNELLLRHKLIHESHMEIAKEHFGDKFNYFKEDDEFKNQKQKDDFYANYRHRQHLSFHLVKGKTLESLDLTSDAIDNLTAEEIEKFSK